MSDFRQLNEAVKEVISGPINEQLEIHLDTKQDSIVVTDRKGRDGASRRVLPVVHKATKDTLKNIMNDLKKKHSVTKSGDGMTTDAPIGDVDKILQKYRDS